MVFVHMRMGESVYICIHMHIHTYIHTLRWFVRMRIDKTHTPIQHTSGSCTLHYHTSGHCQISALGSNRQTGHSFSKASSELIVPFKTYMEGTHSRRCFRNSQLQFSRLFFGHEHCKPSKHCAPPLDRYQLRWRLRIINFFLCKFVFLRVHPGTLP
jgi:hypothetical protein